MTIKIALLRLIRATSNFLVRKSMKSKITMHSITESTMMCLFLRSSYNLLGFILITATLFTCSKLDNILAV